MAETKLVKTPLDELTYRIIGCAMAVHRKLRPGYRENTYQRDLQINISERSLAYHRVLLPRNLQEHHVNRQWLFVPDWLKPEKE